MRRQFRVILAVASLCACSTPIRGPLTFATPYQPPQGAPPGQNPGSLNYDEAISRIKNTPSGSDIPELTERYREALTASGVMIRGPLDQPVDGLQPDIEEIRLLATGGRQTDFDLDDYGRLIAAALPGMSAARAVEALKADLSAMAASPDRDAASYAALIAESGSTSSGAVQTAFPDNRITAAQLALILYRLGVELQTSISGPLERRGELIRAQPTLARTIQRNASSINQPEMLSAAAVNESQSSLVHLMADTQTPSLPGCQWPNGAALWVRTVVGIYLPLPSRFFFSELQRAYSIVALQPALQAANILFAYAKVFAVYSSAETSIKMVDAPLIRNQDRRRGQRRELVATVVLHLGNWQFLGCFREALLAAGLKLDFPADGPIEGAKVTWSLASGSQSVTWGKTDNGRATAQVATPLVELEAVVDDTQRLQTGRMATVQNLLSATTNSAGQARMGVWGAPRSQPVPSTAARIKKEFTVRVEIAPMPISLSKFISKATISASGGLPGIFRSPITLPADLALSTRWLPGIATLPVIDWGSVGYKLDQAMWHWGVKAPDNPIGLNTRRPLGTAAMSDALFCPVDDTWKVSASWTWAVGMIPIGRVSCLLHSGHCEEFDGSWDHTVTFTVVAGDPATVTIEDHLWDVSFDAPKTFPMVPTDDCTEP